MRLPLAGIRVIDLAQMWAALLARGQWWDLF